MKVIALSLLCLVGCASDVDELCAAAGACRDPNPPQRQVVTVDGGADATPTGCFVVADDGGLVSSSSCSAMWHGR